MQKEVRRTREWHVPVEPIRQAIRESELQSLEVAKRVWGDSIYKTNPRGPQYHCERNLFRVMNVTTWIDFDVADRILAALGETSRWLTDPVLSECYETINLRALDAASPTCPLAQEEIRCLIQGAYRGNMENTAKELGIGEATVRKYLRGALSKPVEVAA